jgi:DNA repair exonuclease SbcCD ATPase subunit
MLVDRDKAIEACAQVCELIDWPIFCHSAEESRLNTARKEVLQKAAAAIRQLTLEDCRVEGDSEFSKRPENAGLPAHVYQQVESLSAQVDEEHERAEAYGNVASKLQDKLYAAEAQVAELKQQLNTPITKVSGQCVKGHSPYWISLYGRCMACRAEAAEAQVAELRKDAERYRWLRSEEVATDPRWYPFWDEFNVKLCRENKMDKLIDAAKESGNE